MGNLLYIIYLSGWLILISFPVASFSLFCPRNFQLVNVGDSIATVRQKCGNPDEESVKKEPIPTPQEWSYFISQTVSTNGQDQVPGSLKTTLVFDAAGRLINLSVNGIGVGATSICGPTIQLGDTIETTKARCGEPAFVLKPSREGNNTNEQTITLFSYHTPSPVIFRFKEGILTDVQ